MSDIGVGDSKGGDMARYVFPLSARDESVLGVMVQDLLAFVETIPEETDLLRRMAYTLQVGREQMDVRLVVEAASLSDLRARLSDLAQRSLDGAIGRKTKRRSDKAATGSSVVAVPREQLDSWIAQQDFVKLAEAWLEGANIEWAAAYGDARPRRMNLPAYPFKTQRYWITESRGRKRPGHEPLPTAPLNRLDVHEGSDQSGSVTVAPVTSEEVLAGEESIIAGSGPTVTRPDSQGDRTMQDHRSTMEKGTGGKTAERMSLGQLQDELSAGLAAALFMDDNDIDLDETFFELGVESVSGVEWIRDLNERYGVSLKVSAIYDTPTLRTFADFLYKTLKENPDGLPMADRVEAATPVSVREVARHPAIEDKPPVAQLENVTKWLVQHISDIVMISPENIDTTVPFSELGLGGQALHQLSEQIGASFGLWLSPDEVARHRTPLALGTHVQATSRTNPTGVDAIKGERATSDPKPDANLISSGRHKPGTSGTPEPIAVIGIAGQFPMAESVGEFWDRLAAGQCCVGGLPYERWNMPRPTKEGDDGLYPHAGVLEHADKFDPLFFNVSPKEAKLMEPQQRVFMQNCWTCVEDAGYAPSQLAGTRCGVFAGCSGSGYGIGKINEPSTHALMGHTTSILPARVSYHMNLKGPCMAIDTACSSSLVALSEACTSLSFGGCDVALAGGVSVFASPVFSQMAVEGGMLSEDGRCFTFDQNANGFVPSEGVGVFLLKRLGDALDDGDRIYGLIRAWGINHDGRTNGMTAPSVVSQTDLECEVYERFGIDPETISYVEAHGTGTRLGDPIEVQGLTDAFRRFTDKQQFCALGSVKSNIGHALAAAGAAGVLKVLLSLQHAKLPASINYRQLNDEISMEGSPFYVNDSLTEWQVDRDVPRRAAISSFSYNGTNAHAVIEEFVPASRDARTDPVSEDPQLVLISARTEQQLLEQVSALHDHVREVAGRPLPPADRMRYLADLAYTLQVGRDAMIERIGFTARSLEDLVAILSDIDAGHMPQACSRSNAKAGRKATDRLSEEERQAHDRQIADALARGDLDLLHAQWARGAQIDWRDLYRPTQVKRMSLPTYPFSKRRFWVGDEEKPAAADAPGEVRTVRSASDSKPQSDELDELFAARLEMAAQA